MVTGETEASLDMLLEKVWGWEYSDDIDLVRVCIWHLRRKIEPQPVKPRYIINEPGVGYFFRRAEVSVLKDQGCAGLPAEPGR